MPALARWNDSTITYLAGEIQRVIIQDKSIMICEATALIPYSYERRQGNASFGFRRQRRGFTCQNASQFTRFNRSTRTTAMKPKRTEPAAASIYTQRLNSATPSGGCPKRTERLRAKENRLPAYKPQAKLSHDGI